MTTKPIPRREALRRLGMLTGGALSASTVAGLLAGCRAETDASGYAFQVLDRDSRALTDALVDLILPDTDTPGAKAAGVSGFIDKLLADWMPDDERDRFLAGLADLDARARRDHGDAFVSLSPDKQMAFLTTLDNEAFPDQAAESAPEQASDEAAVDASTSGSTDAMQDAAKQEVGPADSTVVASADTAAAPAEPVAEAPAEEETPAEEAPPPFFMTLKELTIAGYYTSEIGATQELQWNPAPGRYDGDLPLSDVGRAWA